jgi:hypothetical protein
MLMAIENRDFIECVCKTRSEAEEYYSKHPSRETCRIIEIESKRFPLFVTEVGYGNFSYFPTKKALIEFLRSLDIESFLKQKIVYNYIYGSDEYGREEKIEARINLYRYAGSFRGEKMDYDYMGMIDHEHLNPEWINRIIQSNSLRCVGMERGMLRKMIDTISRFLSRRND